jgi:hypothetical protein
MAHDPDSAIVPELLRSERGPVYRIARRLRIWPGPGGAVRIGIAIAAIAWIPLVLLSAIDGRLLGGATIPMAGSLSVHARFLVAIPLFFLAESLFGDRAGDALGRLLRTEVVAGEDRVHYVRAWKRALSHWDHGAMEAALVALTLTAIYVGFRTDLPAGVSAWRTQVDGSLTFAGWWYSLVALPLFQFLLWRWGWRLLAWGWLLWRISRLRLRLVPIHPDRAGGLGGLGVAHADLSPLLFACSAMIAATFAERILFGGAALSEFAEPFVTVVTGLTALAVAPLFFFSKQLLDAKQRGLLEYTTLASTYVRAFDEKWLRGGAPKDEPLLGSADLQSLADLGNSFGVVGQMRFVPIGSMQVLGLAAAAVLPMLPLMTLAFPLDELIIGGLKSLVGL